MKTINLKNAMTAYNTYTKESDRVYSIKRIYGGSSPALPEAEAAAQTAWTDFLTASAALSEAIDAEQKRCTSRKIEAKDVCKALAAVEEKLNLPKRLLNGVSVTIDCNAQDFPKAYKYTPESTIFQAAFKSGSWKVTDIFRGKTKELYKGTHVELTDEAKAAIIERALKEHTTF